MTFDSHDPSTSADAWLAAPRMHDRPQLDLQGVGELVVVAPHPDDETLGAGGLIAHCVQLAIPVVVILVTDGNGGGLHDRRAAEFATAMTLLGARSVSLEFPDGQTDTHRTGIREALRWHIGSARDDAMVVSPWRGDGHRDHRVVGEIVAQVAGGRRLIEYPVWLWHWGSPAHADVPWDRLVALPIDRRAKSDALAIYRSQIEGEHPVLRSDFLQNFDRDTEYFVLPESALGRDYFESRHQRRRDPWGFETRWYEERKRAMTLASLPSSRFETGLEIGCSIGVLTDALVSRVDSLLAIDVSQAAVDRARERLGGRARVERADVLSDFPSGTFELIVLSEVGYYFDAKSLERVLDSVEHALAPGGTVIACHWRHPVTDYPLRGDAVHEALRRRPLITTVLHEEKDFVLEVFSYAGISVAEATGLA